MKPQVAVDTHIQEVWLWQWSLGSHAHIEQRTCDIVANFSDMKEKEIWLLNDVINLLKDWTKKIQKEDLYKFPNNILKSKEVRDAGIDRIIHELRKKTYIDEIWTIKNAILDDVTRFSLFENESSELFSLLKWHLSKMLKQDWRIYETFLPVFLQYKQKIINDTDMIKAAQIWINMNLIQPNLISQHNISQVLWIQEKFLLSGNYQSSFQHCLTNKKYESALIIQKKWLDTVEDKSFIEKSLQSTLLSLFCGSSSLYHESIKLISNNFFDENDRERIVSESAKDAILQLAQNKEYCFIERIDNIVQHYIKWTDKYVAFLQNTSLHQEILANELDRFHLDNSCTFLENLNMIKSWWIKPSKQWEQDFIKKCKDQLNNCSYSQYSWDSVNILEFLWQLYQIIANKKVQYELAIVVLNHLIENNSTHFKMFSECITIIKDILNSYIQHNKKVSWLLKHIHKVFGQEWYKDILWDALPFYISLETNLWWVKTLMQFSESTQNSVHPLLQSVIEQIDLYDFPEFYDELNTFLQSCTEEKLLFCVQQWVTRWESLQQIWEQFDEQRRKVELLSTRPQRIKTVAGELFPLRTDHQRALAIENRARLHVRKGKSVDDAQQRSEQEIMPQQKFQQYWEIVTYIAQLMGIEQMTKKDIVFSTNRKGQHSRYIYLNTDWVKRAVKISDHFSSRINTMEDGTPIVYSLVIDENKQQFTWFSPQSVNKDDWSRHREHYLRNVLQNQTENTFDWLLQRLTPDLFILHETEQKDWTQDEWVERIEDKNILLLIDSLLQRSTNPFTTFHPEPVFDESGKVRYVNIVNDRQRIIYAVWVHWMHEEEPLEGVITVQDDSVWVTTQRVQWSWTCEQFLSESIVDNRDRIFFSETKPDTSKQYQEISSHYFSPWVTCTAKHHFSDKNWKKITIMTNEMDYTKVFMEEWCLINYNDNLWDEVVILHDDETIQHVFQWWDERNWTYKAFIDDYRYWWDEKALVYSTDSSGQMTNIFWERVPREKWNVIITPDDLDQDQQRVLTHLALWKNVFVSWRAWTGKSAIINFLQTVFNNKNIEKTASTWFSAKNINWFTTSSALKLRIFENNDLEIIEANKWSGLKDVDIFVVDEALMFNTEQLRQINLALQAMHGNKELFGWKQVIFLWDIAQLEPFTWQNWIGTHYFNDFVTIDLQTIHRQESNTFKSILEHFRSDVLKSLLSTSKNELLPYTSLEWKNWLIITWNKERANEINEHVLKSFWNTVREFEPTIEWVYTKELPYETLKIAPWMQVMCTRNCTMWGRYGTKLVNWDIGIVTKIHDDEVVVCFQGKWVVRITLMKDEQYRSKEVEWSVSYFPLIPAYAVTVWKAQWLTLQEWVIDSSVFASENQRVRYTAVSRFKTLDGIHITDVIAALKRNKWLNMLRMDHQLFEDMITSDQIPIEIIKNYLPSCSVDEQKSILKILMQWRYGYKIIDLQKSLLATTYLTDIQRKEIIIAKNQYMSWSLDEQQFRKMVEKFGWIIDEVEYDYEEE
jgi:AAA domain